MLQYHPLIVRLNASLGSSREVAQNCGVSFVNWLYLVPLIIGQNFYTTCATSNQTGAKGAGAASHPIPLSSRLLIPLRWRWRNSGRRANALRDGPPPLVFALHDLLAGLGLVLDAKGRSRMGMDHSVWIQPSLFAVEMHCGAHSPANVV